MAVGNDDDHWHRLVKNIWWALCKPKYWGQ